MDLDPTGEIKSIPKGYLATLRGKQTSHGDCEAVWMGQKGKKNFLSMAGRLTIVRFCFQYEGHGDKKMRARVKRRTKPKR